jgi:hypothetical protein
LRPIPWGRPNAPLVGRDDDEATARDHPDELAAVPHVLLDIVEYAIVVELPAS